MFPGNYRPTQNGVEAIVSENPGKVYITLGTNALMAMEPEEFIESYYQLVAKIRQTSPATTIYIRWSATRA